MNFTQLSLGEFKLARWHERVFESEGNGESKYNPPRDFRYKTYDDTQWRQNRSQRQSGGRSSTFSVSIQTSCGFPFKYGDRIEFVDELVGGKPIILGVSAVEKVKNTPYAMNSLFYSKANNAPVRLHLNKD